MHRHWRRAGGAAWRCQPGAARLAADVIDAGDPATGASGLPVGLFGPTSSDDNVFTRVSRAGCAPCCSNRRPCWRKRWTGAPAACWSAAPANRACPGLEGRPRPDWNHAAPTATLQTAGLPEDSTACWHARCAGWVRPQRLVERLLAQPGIRLRLGHRVAGLQRSDAGDWQVMDAQEPWPRPLLVKAGRRPGHQRPAGSWRRPRTCPCSPCAGN